MTNDIIALSVGIAMVPSSSNTNSFGFVAWIRMTTDVLLPIHTSPFSKEVNTCTQLASFNDSPSIGFSRLYELISMDMYELISMDMYELISMDMGWHFGGENNEYLPHMVPTTFERKAE